MDKTVQLTPPQQSATALIRIRAAAWLATFASSLERHPSLFLLPFIALFLLATLAASHQKALWHDELFTFYIAQAPSLHDLWIDVRTLDLNPPLVYLLTRGCFSIFGPGTLATRLPEMLFFLILLLAIYRFVQHRLGPLYGGFAIALLFLGKTCDFAVEARPYTLLLGFLALAIVGWQQASEQTGLRRRLSIALLSFSVAGMLLSHIFSIPAIAALLLAELWRERILRRLDLPILAAMLLPGFIVLLYGPMLRNHAGAIYPQFLQPDGQAIFDFYIGSIERELICLLLTALFVVTLLGISSLRGQRLRDRPRWGFTQPEWVLFIALLTLPLLLMLQLMRTHGAFFPRYGAFASLAIVCLVAALLCRWTAANGIPDPRPALLGIFVAVAMSEHTITAATSVFDRSIFHAASEPVLQPCDSCRRTASPDSGDQPVPLVDASGLAFLEMNHNETPATLDRLYYLTDPQASTIYAHANIFEQMPQLVGRFHLRGHAVNYHDFLSTHQHFYVLGRCLWQEDWLLPKLLAEGADVRLAAEVHDDYRDTELYEVRTRVP